MNKVKITTEFDHEAINKLRNNTTEIRDLYIQYCVEGTSPADDANDMLTILRYFHNIDYHFLSLTRKMYNQENRLKGEEILYPEVE
jgi:hypothetical protein